LSRRQDRSVPSAPGTPGLRPLGPQTGRRLRAAGFRLRGLGIEQALRLATCLLAILWRELSGRLGELLATGEARSERRARRRALAAKRLAKTLGELKGPFVKLGQFASLRVDVWPAPLRAALEGLQDRVPPRPLVEVVAVIEAELGAPLQRCFASFDAEPLGTASVAQVHRARLPDGEPVAVKVQFPWLERSLRADLALTRILLGLASLGSRGLVDRRRLFQEFASGLREELDFEHEARVAGEIARNLADQPQVVVPHIYRSHSTARVLTMSYVPGVRLTDRAGLDRLGVSPRAALEILCAAYAKQVFVDGCFHADPHPGNLFVVDEPGARQRPRVLFVDFGLSKRLSAELRREMRVGILALLQGNGERFLSAMARMDMIAAGAQDQVREAIERMLRRIREEGSPVALSGGQVLGLKNEAKELLSRTEGIQLPNELLLYAKTVSYLFALGAQLDPEVNVMRLSLPYLLQFLGERESSG
jgi:ubiquinone biosynthesis protein